MFVHLDLGTGTASVRDPDDLKALSVLVAGPGGDDAAQRALGALGSLDGDHAWLDVEALRAAAGEGRDGGWHEGFDAMVAYAASKGWLDADGTAVRAHLVREDGA